MEEKKVTGRKIHQFEFESSGISHLNATPSLVYGRTGLKNWGLAEEER